MIEKAPPPSDTADKFMLRMPDGMRELVRRSAEKSGRSMNAEIVHRLIQSYQDQFRMSDAFKDATVDELAPYLMKLLEDVYQMQRVIEHKLSERNKPTPIDDDELPF